MANFLSTIYERNFVIENLPYLGWLVSLGLLIVVGALILRCRRYADIIANERHMNHTLTEQWQHLSQHALLQQHQTFVDLARTSLEGTLQSVLKQSEQTWQTKHVQMEATLTPIQKTLGEVDQKLALLEKERLEAYADLRRHVLELNQTQNKLRHETSQLVQALRTPTARGQWGEMQLRRVVEMAGMVNHCDFVEQASLPNNQRPDLVVHLPGQKCIVIDAKTPLSAYLSAMNTTDDNVRQHYLTEHAKQVRQHLKSLGQKAYWSQFDTSPEFVVLFLPGESFFSAALEYDPSLIEAGVNEKVLIATPTTLIALLRSVAYGWRQESLAEHSRAIGALGKELFTRLSEMTDHINNLGLHLQRANQSFHKTSTTLDRRVLSSARKLADMDPSLDAKTLDLDEHDLPILAANDA